ncbi:hypothetical protein FGO68_gene14224 [Halteria grandinella]|uniref:Uncharacterized protein n=1 Tax=Halteria grandinella TaxID=5974 RepID=A0A8J8NXF8_HALGN|nr:hypothetical protein FGO68_gene14224 [Halteria grandinella]
MLNLPKSAFMSHYSGKRIMIDGNHLPKSKDKLELLRKVQVYGIKLIVYSEKLYKMVEAQVFHVLNQLKIRMIEVAWSDIQEVERLCQILKMFTQGVSSINRVLIKVQFERERIYLDEKYPKPELHLTLNGTQEINNFLEVFSPISFSLNEDYFFKYIEYSKLKSIMKEQILNGKMRGKIVAHSSVIDDDIKLLQTFSSNMQVKLHSTIVITGLRMGKKEDEQFPAIKNKLFNYLSKTSRVKSFLQINTNELLQIVGKQAIPFRRIYADNNRFELNRLPLYKQLAKIDQNLQTQVVELVLCRAQTQFNIAQAINANYLVLTVSVVTQVHVNPPSRPSLAHPS